MIPGTTWQQWVNTTQTTSANAWNVWVQQAMTQQLTSGYVGQQEQVWQVWQTQPYYGLNVGVSPLVTAAAPWVPLTPEQEAERAVRRQRETARLARQKMIYHNRDRAKELRRKPARRRAEALLLESMTPSQMEEWERNRSFTVITADGKRAYRIAYGYAGNIRMIKCDEPVYGKHGRRPIVGSTFCCHAYHPDGWLPIEDHVLAQKLLLEADEEHFLRLANVS